MELEGGTVQGIAGTPRTTCVKVSRIQGGRVIVQVGNRKQKKSDQKCPVEVANVRRIDQSSHTEREGGPGTRILYKIANCAWWYDQTSAE